METVVLATRNPGKVKELAALLAGRGIAVLGLDAFPGLPEVEESGQTFEENALLKARAVCKATGLTAVADDSGLEVAALNNAPGVFSARFSAMAGGEAGDAANNAHLLALLRNVPPERRQARFVCVVAVCAPQKMENSEAGTGKNAEAWQPQEFTARGEWDGQIALKPAGEQGFGYDPLFFDPELGRTAAQMTAETKNSRSHRGKALQALLTGWPAALK